jgi:hypothetical protein
MTIKSINFPLHYLFNFCSLLSLASLSSHAPTGSKDSVVICIVIVSSSFIYLIVK